MRPRLIVGNWKMHKTATDAVQFVRQLSELIPEPKVEVVLAPPFTALHAAAQAMPASRPFTLSAQNLYWEDQGAFTGEVSAPMLTDLGCRYVIIGHSERRQWFGDHDDGVNKKIKAAIRHGLGPILCAGESLAQREQGGTDVVVTEQVRHALEGLSHADIQMVTIAYEPVWAIGTGRAATPEQAVAVHQVLRMALAHEWGAEAGKQTRILYGGSVSPENAADLFASDEIDGALVGGACLDPNRFARIVALA
ncbi:MAG: triose-phosphate isomerase [Nitrospiraceae bacterium]